MAETPDSAGATDFPHADLVQSWIAALTLLHGEAREFLDMVAEKVKTESAFYLHFAGLGLRNLVAEAVRSGELSQSFRDRAEAVLWGLEVIADDSRQFGLPLDAVKSVVETALSCSEDQLHGVDPIINIAERARWLERSEMRALLADWDEGRLACGPWTGAVDALRRLLLDGWRPGATGS